MANYSPIISGLRDREFANSVALMFRYANLNSPTTDERTGNREECAKAFLIHLAVTAFGVSSSYKTDLILSEMALLEGYYSGVGLQERRVKFLIESNYHVKRNPDDVDNKDLPYEVLSDRAKQFNKTDAPIFEEMIAYFIDKVKDKLQFYRDACERYLEKPADGHKIQVVRLPAPSYSTKFEEPIKHIPLLPSPDFIGRDDYLSILERGFREEDGRCIYVLHGIDGIGKTEIALQYAERHISDYNTVIWLDATSIETLKADCQMILRSYGQAVTDPDDTDQTAVTFCRFIKQRNDALLIFDNADYLTNDPGTKKGSSYWLRRFIPSGNVDVIITTYCNGDLPGTRALDIYTLDADIALELLSGMASREPDEYAARLAKRLGYLPLGIEYAGAYIREMGISYKDYLDKWERLGVSLFDQNDSTDAIRGVFHITLEKIKNVPFALSFLQFFSELGVNALPLKEFLDTSTKLHFLSMKDLDQHPIYMPIDDGTGREILYRIIEARPDGTEVLEGPDGDRKTIIVQKNPLFEWLSSENNRDRLILALKKYSLVSSNGGMVFAHPLLLEFIFDECHHESRSEWIKEKRYAGILYEAYTRIGSEQRAREQLYQIICHNMEQIRKEIEMIPKMAMVARTNGFNLFNVGDILILADSTISRAEQYGDDELVNRCEELRKQLEDVLDAVSDVNIDLHESEI